MRLGAHNVTVKYNVFVRIARQSVVRFSLGLSLSLFRFIHEDVSLFVLVHRQRLCVCTTIL